MIKKNVIILYIIHIAKLILPLLLFPILSERLSQYGYGLYMYTIAVASWLSIFIEYGFNIYSTREISGRPTESKLLVILGTQSAKVLLSFMIVPICFLISSNLSFFKGSEFWVFISWLLAVLIGFSPIYYFQAIEKLKDLAIAELLSSFVLLILVFFLVKDDNDLTLLGILLILTRFFSVFYLTWSMLRDLSFSVFGLIDFRLGLVFLKKSFHFFIFQAAVSLYTSFNVVFLGILKSPIEVGQYASAEKLIKAGLGFINPISQAIFPRLNNLKALGVPGAKKLRRQTLFVMLIIGILGMTITLMISKFITSFLFPQDKGEILAILNILSLVFPAIALGNVLGFLHLVVENQEKVFNKIILFAAILNIFLAYFMITHFGIRGMAFGWVAVEWMITALITYKILAKTYSFKLGK